MKEETEQLLKDCPRCHYGHPLQCWRCNQRDEEERKAWVQFAATSQMRSGFSDAAEVADILLEQFRARFPYPAKEVAKCPSK